MNALQRMSRAADDYPSVRVRTPIQNSTSEKGTKSVFSRLGSWISSCRLVRWISSKLFSRAPAPGEPTATAEKTQQVQEKVQGILKTPTSNASKPPDKKYVRLVGYEDPNSRPNTQSQPTPCKRTSAPGRRGAMADLLGGISIAPPLSTQPIS